MAGSKKTAASKKVKKNTAKAVKSVEVKKTVKAGGVKAMASKRIKFEVQAESGSEVYIAGTFNGWNPKQNKLREKSGLYSGTLLLQKGRHEYKFVINGVWCVDPKCQEWVPNEYGSLNSVVVVE